MKKILFITCCIFIHITGLALAADTPKILEQADQLVTSKQYDSAFSLLNETDKNGDNPEIVLKQVDIALNYFATSTMHQMFGFKDLQPGETIEDIRGTSGVYTYYKFEIDKILDKLIAKYPENWQLYKALGEFYYEVSVKYGNNWLKKEQELLDLAESNCLKAEQNGVFDAKSLYTIGEAELQKKNYQQAVSYYLRSLELDSKIANTNYNLAYAYLYLSKFDEGLKYAEVSLNLYGDKVYKADAARLMAVFYRNKNEDPNAIKYYKVSEEINPNNYYNLTALLELYIKANELGAAADTADALFALEPTEAQLTQDVVRSYYNNNQNDELFKFFDRMEKKYAKQDQVMGNLLFYKAYVYKFIKDFKQAKACFTSARKYFAKSLEKDNDVFELIEKELEEL